VGSNAEVLALADQSTTLIDLAGQTVLPGLIYAHGHVSGLGSLYAGVVDLSETKSYAEVVDLVAEQAKERPAGSWILGHGWDHESWAPNARGVRELPTHGSLSEAVPDHPVYLMRVDGHAGLANANAMRLAEITRASVSLPGGEIIRDAKGEPTGVFIDNAELLITDFIPSDASGRFESLVLAAQNALIAGGITGVHDMGVTPAEAARYQMLANTGQLVLRIDAAISAPFAARFFTENEPFSGEILSVRSTKVYMDGAMGSRGAWLLEPYADRATDDAGTPYTGLAVSDPADIESLAHLGMERGFQICAHAIGDRANREVLDAFERAHASYARDSGPVTPQDPSEPRPMGVPVRSLDQFRFRVEHAQIIHYSDIPRFAQLGVIPSMQASHQTSDMYWAGKRLGPERLLGAYAWRSLLNTGVIIPNGSDFPVEYVNPLISFHAAIARQDANDFPVGGWYPDQRMTREEALRSMTLWPAYSAFQENELGSLSVGKHADFVVLDQDIMRVAPELVLKTEVLSTWVGGKAVYERRAQP
jgi:predicted amidohydrolase YtcJ